MSITEIVDLLDRFHSWDTLANYFILTAVFAFCPGLVLALLLKIPPDDDFETRKAVMADLHSIPCLKRWWFVAEQAVGVVVYGVPDRARSWWSKYYADQPVKRRSDIHWLLAMISFVGAAGAALWDSFFGGVPVFYALLVSPSAVALAFVARRFQKSLMLVQRGSAEAALSSAAADARTDLLIAESEATRRLMCEKVDELNGVTQELTQLLDQMEAERDDRP